MKKKKECDQEVKLQNIQGIGKKIDTGLDCYSRVYFKGYFLLLGLVLREECDQEVKLRNLEEYPSNKTQDWMLDWLVKNVTPGFLLKLICCY